MDKELLRVGIIAELDAVSLYEQLASATKNTMIKRVFLDIAKEEKCNRVRWQVSKWNTEAVKLYKKIGAKIDDTEMNCDMIFSDT